MFKSLFRHSLIYGIANALHSATSFLLLPLYTSYLSVGEYGTLEIFLVSITILVSLLHLGLGSALFKYYSYDNETTESDQYNKLIISSSYYFLFIFAFITVLITTILGSNNLSRLIFDNQLHVNLIVLSLFIVFLEVLWVIPTSYLRIQNKSLKLSIINGVKFLFQVMLTIYLVVALNRKIEGVLLARIITAGVFACCFLWVIWGQLSFAFSFSVVKELLSYSIYLVPVSICTLVLMMSNRYFILLYYDSEMLGLFSVANRIASLLLLAVMAFQMAWPSIMFRIKEQPNAKKLYTKIFSYYVFVFGLLVLLITMFSKELILILANSDYLNIAPLISILSFSYFFYGCFFVGSVGINIFKKTYYQSVAMILAAGSNIVLNYYMTASFGITGSAIATTLSFALVGILAFSFSQRVYFIPVEWWRIIKYFTILLLVSLLYFGFLSQISIYRLAFKVIFLIAVIPWSMLTLKILSSEEKKYLANKVRICREYFSK